MELMEIGKVVNTFGIKGELKILPYVKYFEDLNRINIKNNTYEIERMRKQKNLFIHHRILKRNCGHGRRDSRL